MTTQITTVKENIFTMEVYYFSIFETKVMNRSINLSLNHSVSWLVSQPGEG